MTDSEIRVATISDPGYTAIPGLNQEIFDSADGFVGWCNSVGGINGRKIVVDKLDAKVVNYKSVVGQACKDDLALVGDGSVGDSAGVQDRVNCGMPAFPAFTASPGGQDGAMTWQTQPNATDQGNPIPALKLLSDKIPGSWSNQGGLIFDVSKTNQTRNCQAITKAGGKCVYQGVISSSGEASYAPFVQAAKSAGVKQLFWIGDEHTATSILQAMADQNAFPGGFIMSPNLYTQTFVKLAGSLADKGNIYTYSLSVPFSDASTNPLIAKYLAIQAKFSPKTAQTGLAVTAFEAWLLWANAAKACGSNLSRTCLNDQASKVTSWDAGGLQVSTNVAQNRISACAMLLKLTPTAWTRFVPSDQGFACAPDAVVAIPGLGLGAKKTN